MKKTTFAILFAGLAASLSTPTNAFTMPELGDPSCDSLLLVSGWWNNNVKIYDGCSGEYIRDLDSQSLIKGPLGMLQAPDGDLLLISETNSRLLKFDYETLSHGTVIMGDDPNTTEAEDNFIKNPVGMTIAEDGTLYVGSYSRNNVVKIDTSSWEIVEEILPPNNGHVKGIDVGLLLDGGHLYVPGWDSHNVIKIDLTDNEVSTAIAASAGGLKGTRAILPDGDDLIVSGENSGAIYRFDKSSGELKNKVIEIGKPTGMRDDGDGFFIVSTQQAVHRVSYDGGSSEQLVETGAGNLSGGTYVYRLYKTSDDDDKDGLVNDEEAQHGTDPQKADTDGDTLNDGDEVHVHDSNPLSNDSDSDQMPDGFEVEMGLLINIADDTQDPDEDNLTNLQEFKAGTHPKKSDTDGDGELDGFDADPLIPNTAPAISGTPASDVEQDAEYKFEPEVRYAGDMATVSLSIANKPEWLTFDAENGVLTGTPGNDQVGTYSDILISATNGHHVVALDSFDIQVININDAPTMVKQIPAQTFKQGESVSVNFSTYFEDMDEGDSLAFSATSLPAGLSLSEQGMLTGSPSEKGQHSFKLAVSDNAGATVETDVKANVEGKKSSGGSTSSYLLTLLTTGFIARRHRARG